MSGEVPGAARVQLVDARMLSYTDQQTTRPAADAGASWSRYAPGDHSS